MRRLVLVLLLASVRLGQGVPPPDVLYSLQIGAFPSQYQAEKLAAELRLKGWSPVEVTMDKSLQQFPAKVRFGRFETQADAEWWKLGLRNREFKDSFIIFQPNELGLECLPTSGPMTQNFKTVTSFSSSLAQLTSLLSDGNPNREAISFLLSTEPERLNSNTTVTKELIASLLPIANGDILASKIDVCRSRLAVANAEHYARFRLLTAYQAYGDALELAAEGSVEEAECLLQRAAVLKELSDASKASKESTRRSCKIVLERVAPSNKRAHAVATLMFAETMVDEGKFEEALPHLFAIARNWPDRRREVAGAQVYAGIACARLNRMAEAKELLIKVIHLNLSPQDYFMWRGKYNVQAYDAAKWLAHICEKSGDTTGAEQWHRKIIEFENNLGDLLIKRGAPAVN